MSKRLDPKLWMDVATFIADEKDKSHDCAYCKQPLPQPLNNRDGPRREWASINHIDSNEADWRMENLNLMHIHCNNSYRGDMQRKVKLEFLLRLATERKAPAKTESSTVGAGERVENVISSPPRFRIIPVASDAYSNRKSHECRPVYQRHVFARILAGFHQKTPEYYEYDDLNDDGANIVGEISNTTGRYLNALLSRSGPLDNPQDEATGKHLIILRHPEYYWLNVDELMEVFPVEGIKSIDPKRVMVLMKLAEERRPKEELSPDVTDLGNRKEGSGP